MSDIARTPDADEAARELADALETRPFDYAIGGALALGQWGVVRGTLDVDLNLWADPARPTEAAHLLGELGCELRASAVIRAFLDTGHAFVSYRGVRVDVYLPVRDFHDAVLARRRRRPLLGRDAWFLSAEDLAVFKLILFRAKDRADLESLLVVRSGELDSAYVRSWISRVAGEHDLRVAAWDELVRAAQQAIRLRGTDGEKPRALPFEPEV